MFQVAADEIRAWWWMVRSKTGSMIAFAAVALGTTALHSEQKGNRRRATLARWCAAGMLAVSRIVVPSPIANQADFLTRQQFGA